MAKGEETPRTRPPWTLYAVTVMTGGLFAFPWIMMIMSDLNQIAHRRIFGVFHRGLILSAGLALVLLILFLVTLIFLGDAQPRTERPFWFQLTILTVGLVGIALMDSVIRVARHLSEVTGRDFQTSDAVIILIFTFTLCFLSLPILQQRLNRLIEATSLPDTSA